MGRPAREKLEQLDLGDVARELERRGLLPGTPDDGPGANAISDADSVLPS